MGYYSDYSGEYKPTKPLTEEQHNAILGWFEQRFGKYEIDEQDEVVFNKAPYYQGDIYFDYWQSEEVRPTTINMKGYNFNEHLVEFCNFARSIGVEYNGCVIRNGEDDNDTEKIEIHNGYPYSIPKVVSWGNAILQTETEADKDERFKKQYAVWKETHKKQTIKPVQTESK